MKITLKKFKGLRNILLLQLTKKIKAKKLKGIVIKQQIQSHLPNQPTTEQ